MIQRRTFLAGSCVLTVWPRIALAEDGRLKLAGSLQQSSLVVGTAKGATVTVNGTTGSRFQSMAFCFRLNYDQTTIQPVGRAFFRRH